MDWIALLCVELGITLGVEHTLDEPKPPSTKAEESLRVSGTRPTVVFSLAGAVDFEWLVR